MAKNERGAGRKRKLSEATLIVIKKRHEEGETITAAADGTVEKIYYDSKTGNTIVFNLGNGYELVYGQLTDIVLSEGQTVKAGDIVGKVGAPTIYYATEGSNVYFKMTKDGNPVNPLDKME